jgi:AraC-like DNA-binding protein
MNISFQKMDGVPRLGISFFWKLAIQTKSMAVVKDQFIPELFLDYLFVKEGRVKCIDQAQGTKIVLPRQTLKTIHAHTITFVFSTPLVLYGARLSLRFAESFWGKINANCFCRQGWVAGDADDLESFRSQIVAHVERRGKRRLAYPMFSSDMDESSWLANFSARHKRRLYASTFGLSRKELQNIRNVHSFLEQTCDFASENPRIIRHVNPEVFYDQAHLNHIFKKMTGFSPVEYFETNSILQDNLMSASYNEDSVS